MASEEQSLWVSLLVYAVVMSSMWLIVLVSTLPSLIYHSISLSTLQGIRTAFNWISSYSLSPLFSYSKDAVIDLHVNNVFYPVSFHSERGGRPYQEDRSGSCQYSCVSLFSGSTR